MYDRNYLCLTLTVDFDCFHLYCGITVLHFNYLLSKRIKSIFLQKR